MASGEKSSSIFTGNSTADSPSAGIKSSKGGVPGQTIKSAYGQNNVHGYDVPDTMGGSFGGGTSNLGHSLKGASAVMDPHKGTKDGVS